MVYCGKCGVQNSDNAQFCINCGAILAHSPEKPWEQRLEEWAEDFGKRAEEWGERVGEQMETEWVWLSRVGAIFGLLIGVIVILAGLQWLLGWRIEAVLRSLGSLVAIIIGVLVLVFTMQWFRPRKS